MWLRLVRYCLILCLLFQLVTNSPLVVDHDARAVQTVQRALVHRALLLVRQSEGVSKADGDDDDGDDDKKKVASETKKDDENDKDDDKKPSDVKEDDKDGDDDKKEDKKDDDKGDDDTKDTKEDDSKENAVTVKSGDDEDNKTKEKPKDDDKDDDDDDNDKSTKKKTKVDEKLDDNQSEEKQKEEKISSSSEEEDSHSNPETEEEGDSDSESDEDDEPLPIGEDEPARDHKKLLIIMASGFRFDYVRIKKLNAISEIMNMGVRPKYVRPAFPANGFPNWYSLATGQNPIKHGFIDNEMYDTKYKEHFPGNGHRHKHWWNKAEPVWITALKHRLQVATYWWRGSCGITIKRRQVQRCIPYKERVGNEEVVRQLRLIVDDFEEDKLDFAMVYYEALDRVGHMFGPDSHKQRQAVRKFDNILEKLLVELRDQNATETVNVLITSDHGIMNAGAKIELSKYIDLNDIDELVSTDAFTMLLPEKGKEDYIFNSLRNAKIEGLNVYRRDQFPKHFQYGNGQSELILPIVLTADRGFWIEKPDMDGDDQNGETSDENDADEPRKGVHGYDPLHVKEMNGAMLAFGPDLKKSKTLDKIDQVDVYGLICRLLNMTCAAKHEANEQMVNQFIRDENDESDEAKNGSDNDSESSEETAPNQDNGDQVDTSAVKPDGKPARSRWANRDNHSSALQFSIWTMVSIFLCRFQFVKLLL